MLTNTWKHVGVMLLLGIAVSGTANNGSGNTNANIGSQLSYKTNYPELRMVNNYLVSGSSEEWLQYQETRMKAKAVASATTGETT